SPGATYQTSPASGLIHCPVRPWACLNMMTEKPASTLPVVKLDQGIHVMHLFYRIDRVGWAQLPAGGSAQIRARLEALCAANAAPSHPRLTTYTNVGDKADLVFML